MRQPRVWSCHCSHHGRSAHSGDAAPGSTHRCLTGVVGSIPRSLLACVWDIGPNGQPAGQQRRRSGIVPRCVKTCAFMFQFIVAHFSAE